MKDFSLGYLDKSYFVDEKTHKIHPRNGTADSKKVHPKDLKLDLTETLGVDDDLAYVVINEWMYLQGLRKLDVLWEEIWWSQLPLPNSTVAMGVGNIANETILTTNTTSNATLTIKHDNSIAIGQNAQAIGSNSIAIGNGAVARDGQICIRTDGPNQSSTGNVIFNGRDITDQIGDAINHALNVHPYE